MEDLYKGEGAVSMPMVPYINAVIERLKVKRGINAQSPQKDIDVFEQEYPRDVIEDVIRNYLCKEL